MNDLPQVGDIIFIDCEDYRGDAVITYIDQAYLFQHHFKPIQVELEEAELNQFDDFNHGQTMRRFSLKDIAGIQALDEVMCQEGQLDLFDDFN